jgi:hypothetical protein
MQDGEVYQVEVSEYAGMRFWIQGSVEAIIELRMAGLRPDVRTETVPFITVESARFEIRRPDTDGNLNWP